MFTKIYRTVIIDFSKISIAIICSVLAYFLYFSKDFTLDASSDSLLLESDKDLKYLREVNERYGAWKGNHHHRKLSKREKDKYFFHVSPDC